MVLRTQMTYWILLLALFVARCDSRAVLVGKKLAKNPDLPHESAPRQQPDVELTDTIKFTDQERQLLRDLRIAVFRNKLILDAQPPVTDAQLADVEKKVDGKLTPELLALWKTSFGGALDYDYEIMFGDHLFSASFSELYYPGSEHYHDLNSWIESEIKAFQTVAEEQGEPIPQRTSLLPFGGFSYLVRFYVSLEPDEYGAVIVYAQAIKRKGLLHEDSVATGARSVTELFDQLTLNEDPFDEKSAEYANGKKMVKRILEIEVKYPELAQKLKTLVRSSIFHWQTIINATDLAGPLSERESKALRLALEFAVNRKDVALIDHCIRNRPHSMKRCKVQVAYFATQWQSKRLKS